MICECRKSGLIPTQMVVSVPQLILLQPQLVGQFPERMLTPRLGNYFDFLALSDTVITTAMQFTSIP